MKVAERMAFKLGVAVVAIAVVPSMAAAQVSGLSEPGDLVGEVVVDELDEVAGDVGDIVEDASDESGGNASGGDSGGSNGSGGVGNSGGGGGDNNVGVGGGGGGGVNVPLLDPRVTGAIVPATSQVCFYALPNFGGESLCLHAGDGFLPLLGEWADRIGSIQLIGQIAALVCDNENFTGICLLVTENMPVVSTRIFSIQVL
jgi:hypothetical protein